MKIVMFGTGPFAVPTLTALLHSTHTVQGLVTRPIEDAGQRRKSSANPMRDLAESRKLPIFDPLDVNAPESIARLKEFQADLFVVCDYGQILSDECLASARLGGINLHGSLLPKFRGAAPIQWAVYRGETHTGVSVILMTRRLDGGPVINSATLPIGPNDTAASLEPPLAALGAQAVLESLNLLASWDGQSSLGFLQDPALVSSARRLRKDDGLIRWTRSAQQIERQIRAFTPWPGAYTFWHRPQGEPLRLIINRATVFEESQTSSEAPALTDTPTPTQPTEKLSETASTGTEPGRIHLVEFNRLVVETGDGLLSLLEVQPAGKKTMPIDAFLRGYPLTIGQRLGNF